MNLATRLWLAILFALFLLLTAIALVRAQYEDRILVDVTLRDRRFLARALYAAIRFNPQSEDPLAEAQAMLERHDLVDPHINRHGNCGNNKRPAIPEQTSSTCKPRRPG